MVNGEGKLGGFGHEDLCKLGGCQLQGDAALSEPIKLGYFPMKSIWANMRQTKTRPARQVGLSRPSGRSIRLWQAEFVDCGKMVASCHQSKEKKPR